MLKLFDLISGCRIRKKNIFFQYSEDEQFTGEYWVDGKKIYSKVIKTNITSASGANNIPHNVSNIGDYRVIDMSNSYWSLDGTVSYNMNAMQTNVSWSNGYGINDKNIILFYGSNWYNGGYRLYITLRYTKN